MSLVLETENSCKLKDAKTLLNGTGTKLSHIHTESNECAYHLARMGAEQEDELAITDETPISISRKFMIRDCLNIRQVLD